MLGGLLVGFPEIFQFQNNNFMKFYEVQTPLVEEFFFSEPLSIAFESEIRISSSLFTSRLEPKRDF